MKWAWSTFWLGVYQPLAWLLFEAQYVFWKLDPRGYHLTSLLLHAANAVVLYVLTVTLLVRCRTDSLLKSPWTCSLGAGLATALFAVHPLRVEAVAWASCQPYLPCALFSMLAVLAYLRAFRTGSSPRWGWLVGSFVLFVAALLSHAVAVSLPAVLLILDVYPLRRLGDGPGRWFGPSARKVWWEKVPFVMVSLVFMGLAIAARAAITGLNRALRRLREHCPGVLRDLVLHPQDGVTAGPHRVLPVAQGDELARAPFLLSILGTLAMSVGLFLLRRRWPGLLAAWLSYLVILAPNSGIIRISDQIAADRYSYMAMLGWVMLAAACLCRLWQMSSRARPGAIGMIALGLGALLGLVPMTWDQCRTWRNSETLWTHALNHGAGNELASTQQPGTRPLPPGEARGGGGSLHRGAAARIPATPTPHNNLGVVLFRQGKYRGGGGSLRRGAAARSRLRRRTQQPGSRPLPPGEVRGGGGSLRRGAAARSRLRRCTQQPGSRPLPPGEVRGGGGSLRRGRCGSIPATPTHTTTWDRPLPPGEVRGGGGSLRRGAAAQSQLRRRTQQPGTRPLPPREVRGGGGSLRRGAAAQSQVRRSHNNLGLVLFRQGKYEEAAARYAEALRLSPNDGEAYSNLAMMMAACPEAKYRDGKRAVESATRACELSAWKRSDFLGALAAAYAEAGDFDAAIDWQTRAIEFLPEDREQDAYRSRLMLYQAKKPYREPPPERVPTKVHP